MFEENYLGCCGAFCGTCKVFKDNICKGCKLGYKEGMRDITKAKCKIKVCCLNHNFETCADCEKLSICEIINSFYQKNGYKYKKYREAIYYIKSNGYKPFLEIANKWTIQYGKYQ